MAAVCMGGDGRGVEFSLGLSAGSEGRGDVCGRGHTIVHAGRIHSTRAGSGGARRVRILWTRVRIGGKNVAAAMAAGIPGGIGAGGTDADCGNGGGGKTGGRGVVDGQKLNTRIFYCLGFLWRYYLVLWGG